jgi:hypothetical protein
MLVPANTGVVMLSSTEADEEPRQVHKFPAKKSKSQSIHFSSAHHMYSTALHKIVATEGWLGRRPNWPWHIWSVCA